MGVSMTSSTATVRIRASSRVILCMIASWFLGSVTLAQAVGRDEFLAQSEAWTAGVGCVLLTYEQQTPDGRGAGRRTIGFDAASGAWFVADHMLGASGRTADGVYFQARGDRSISIGGDSGPVASEASPDQGPVHVSKGVSGYVPLALVVSLRNTSRSLRAIERDSDGNWVISYEGPTADPNVTRGFSVTFDAEGNPRRYYAEADPTTKRAEEAYEFEIEPESPPGLAVVRQRQGGPNVLPPKLVDLHYYFPSRPELFTMESAEAIATDNRIRTQFRLAEIAATYQGSSGSSQPAPYVRTRLSRAGWPLVVSGIIVVAIGLIALFRARMAR